ncbi:MAG: DUF134 domain-containing protein [Asgard group archaeon]|nr:DUF134 domain-containing protein [Asgard group archaeon]
MVQRRKERRCIDFKGEVFKPIGIPMVDLETVELTKEEFTAMYYSDYLQLKQTKAAKKMEISQASFSRELSLAHKKLSDALINTKAIQFEIEPISDS